MKKLTLILFLILLQISYASNENTNGIQNFRTVGPGANCNFDTSNGATLQNALLSGVYDIRVVNSVTHMGPFTPSQQVYIRGGYASCVDAQINNQSVNHTVLDGGAINSTMTLSVNGNYILENIKLINGSASQGGGLNLTAADMTVRLDNVIIENNQAFHGAGIHKTGANNNIGLTIVDSVIQNNTTFAGGIGGGLYFESTGEVIVYGDTLFTQNEADFGGGMYLKETNATLVVGNNPLVDSGIRFNRAREHGGGLYTDFSIVELTGGLKTLPGIGVKGLSGRNYLLLGNMADSDGNLSGLGGGMFLYNNSQITLNAISIVDNHAYDGGGGIYSYISTALTVGYPENSTCQVTNLNGCNFFINNSARFGGAIEAHSSTTSSFVSTNFSGNRANDATIAGLTASTMTITSSVMYNNGNSGIGGFADNYSLATFTDSTLNLEHITAVKNKNVGSFILASNGLNLLNSYNNYFYNPLSGPWLQLFGPQMAIVKHECQMVDDSNNVSDNLHNLVTTSAFFNDTQYFIDEANHDYHLINSSNLIDHTGNNCPSNVNLINNNRDFDNQTRSPVADLGADENLINYPFLFGDGFEN